MTPSHRHGRELLIALSFFNLSVAPMWAADKTYYVEPLPYRSLFVMVVVLGLMLALVAWTLRRHWSRVALQALAGAGFASLPLHGAMVGFSVPRPALATLLIVALAAVAALRQRQKVIQVASGVLLMLSPLLAYSGYLALRNANPAPLAYVHHEMPPETASGRVAGAPVYLVIMDEADYGMAFEHRPSGFALPVLDGLAARSISFTQAYSAGQDTALSIPAMLMGSPLRQVEANGRFLAVTTASGGYAPDWILADNLLRELVDERRGVAVLGHYHPYCSHPEVRFAYCSHWQYVLPFHGWAFEAMPLPIAAWQKNPLVRYAQPAYFDAAAEQTSRAFAAAFEDMAAEVPRALQDRDFALIHMNRPHPDAFPVSVVQARHPEIDLEDYFGWLRDADALLARVLEAAPSRAVVVVTSDHGLRCRSYAAMGYRLNGIAACKSPSKESAFRVPLLVHLPGSHQGLRYEKPVSTLALRSLVRALIDGTVATEEGVVEHFDGRRFDPSQLSTEPSFGPH